MNQRIASTIRELETFIQNKDDALALSREVGEFVYALLRATGAKTGIEIGTSYGYSALWAGAALAEHGGLLITIDREPHKHEIARRYFEQAGLGDAIRCETGVATEVLDRITGRFDYVLNDADKENCTAYVAKLVDRLYPRAVVLTDNTLSHRQELAPFCSWIRKHPAFVSAHVPTGSGMELSTFVGRGGGCDYVS